MLETVCNIAGGTPVATRSGPAVALARAGAGVPPSRLTFAAVSIMEALDFSRRLWFHGPSTPCRGDVLADGGPNLGERP